MEAQQHKRLHHKVLQKEHASHRSQPVPVVHKGSSRQLLDPVDGNRPADEEEDENGGIEPVVVPV
jgi:hypothetical protein